MRTQNRKPRPKKDIPFDVLFRRWVKKTEEDGLLRELRAREFYEKPSEKRRRKHKTAVAKQKREQRIENGKRGRYV